MVESDIATIEAEIEGRLAEGEPDVEVIALERAGSDVLRLYIDRPEGVRLEDCERVTKQLADLLEQWSLEVSSPGPERPLTKPEHFQRFLGHKVRVKTNEEIGGRSTFTGELTGADADCVSVAAPEGKFEIPLAGIHCSNLVPDKEAAK